MLFRSDRADAKMLVRVRRTFLRAKPVHEDFDRVLDFVGWARHGAGRISRWKMSGAGQCKPLARAAANRARGDFSAERVELQGKNQSTVADAMMCQPVGRSHVHIAKGRRQD